MELINPKIMYNCEGEKKTPSDAASHTWGWHYAGGPWWVCLRVCVCACVRARGRAEGAVERVQRTEQAVTSGVHPSGVCFSRTSRCAHIEQMRISGTEALWDRLTDFSLAPEIQEVSHRACTFGAASCYFPLRNKESWKWGWVCSGRERKSGAKASPKLKRFKYFKAQCT